LAKNPLQHNCFDWEKSNHSAAAAAGSSGGAAVVVGRQQQAGRPRMVFRFFWQLALLVPFKKKKRSQNGSKKLGSI